MNKKSFRHFSKKSTALAQKSVQSAETKSVRPVFRPLFVPPDAFVQSALENLPKALNTLLPLNRAHRADLPDAIRELSRLLTSDRSENRHSYWSVPRFVSAYLRYFLPWNLVRLTRILPTLDLPELPKSPEDQASFPKIQIADLGSGPLTMPLALWISRPDWRAVPLTLLCADTAPRPMEIGRRLLEMVAKQSGEPLLWKIHLLRTPLGQALREAEGSLLILAANVLNESLDQNGAVLDERLSELVFSLNNTLTTGGKALFVEPGTRLGGTLTASLRENALEEGLLPLAPCPHTEECPLLRRRSRGWCHAMQTAGGPLWLTQLSTEAGLAKKFLSLSFLLLGREPQKSPFSHVSNLKNTLSARILSDAFPVPEMGYARYACASGGLSLIPDAGPLPFGALVACHRPQAPRQDARSGATELSWKPEQESNKETKKWIK